MADGYLLGGKAVEQLRENHDRLRFEVQKLNARVGTYKHSTGNSLREDAVIGKAESAITARSGTTLGSGTVSIFNKTQGGTAIVDSGRTDVTAYNVTDAAISSGDYVRLIRDFRSGDWIVETVESTGGGSSVREISYVKAQGYWDRTANLPLPSSTSAVVAYVSVKKCDLDGTESGSAFTCYLPITNTGNDPNVVPGQIFIASETEDPSDSATSWSALAGHEDAAIGTVRMLTLNHPSGPESGWAKMDGVDNSDPGSGIDMTGAVPKHDCDVDAGTSNGGTADPSTTSGSTTPGYTLTTINTTLNGGTTSTDSSGTLTTDAASGTTDSAGAHTHATGSHTHTISGTTGTSSGTTGGSGTLTTSTHSIDLVWAEEDMSYTENVAGFNGITDDDADGDPENYTHNHTIASHTHTIGSHSHSFSDTTSSSSGSTSSAGAHTHTFGSHDHDLASHSHTIAVHNHDIPQLSVPGVAHTHTTEKQLTKTLCFFERIDNADWA